MSFAAVWLLDCLVAGKHRCQIVLARPGGGALRKTPGGVFNSGRNNEVAVTRRSSNMILSSLRLLLFAPLIIASSERAGYGAVFSRKSQQTPELLDLRGVGYNAVQSSWNASLVSVFGITQLNPLSSSSLGSQGS